MTNLTKLNAYLNDGLYISTTEEMIETQRDWDDKDLLKEFDFTSHPFWLCTDSEAQCQGLDETDLEELKDYIDLDKVVKFITKS